MIALTIKLLKLGGEDGTLAINLLLIRRDRFDLWKQ
jgi:hypothetical protein